ncbi:hypothetical protein [Nocardia terpenica]|uniref:Uncharacterized protein n=1 Tax=Nocardia terpenica TaxID=455432 RepID=A0A6G9Z8R4_9NOCA|nr:hypothetical protein [Nocardia terpenica]QIS22015.1 hypothetical protein F6W96_30410 [Nocardia terpenica]
MIAGRKATATLTVLGSVTAAIVLGAPQASAAVTRIDIASGLSFGVAPYGTGCSYTITATAQSGTAVAFYDVDEQGNGTRDSFSTSMPQLDASGKATTTWRPITKGQHRILAQEFPTGDATATTNATVGTGINLGIACIVLP